MHKRILVTGGAGFVGTNLCLALRENFEAIEVTAFDSLHRRGSELNLPKLAAGGVKFVQGDVRLRSDLAGSALDPDLIIECSAEPSAQAGYGGASPEFLIETNLSGAYQCLELARLRQADLLFISTSRVYPYARLNSVPYIEDESRFRFSQPAPGVSAEGIREDFPLEGARSLYGTTKLAAELLVEEYADAYGFRFVIDRFGVLTGPGQMAKSDQGVIALWVAAHHYNRPLGYIGFGGTGKQVRDFLHIGDFCNLLVDQIRHFDAYKGQRYNIGGGLANSLSLLESTQLCREITGRDLPMSSQPANRPADVRIYITDNARINAVRGWNPRFDAHRTLSDIHNWLIEGGEPLRKVMFGA